MGVRPLRVCPIGPLNPQKKRPRIPPSSRVEAIGRYQIDPSLLLQQEGKDRSGPSLGSHRWSDKNPRWVRPVVEPVARVGLAWRRRRLDRLEGRQFWLHHSMLPRLRLLWMIIDPLEMERSVQMKKRKKHMTSQFSERPLLEVRTFMELRAESVTIVAMLLLLVASCS